MTTRTTIYDRGGRLLAELDVMVKRSWVKNKPGSASFAISTLDAKCIEEYLQFGNLVLIEHDKLPSWCGYITTPREWGNGVVSVNASGMMGRWSGRSGVGEVNYGGSPGYAIEGFIREMNARDDTRIRMGERVLDGIAEVGSVPNTSKMLEFISQMVDEFKNCLLEFEPGKDDSGRLVVMANWRKLPEEVGLTVLMEGHNIEAVNNVLVEQGTIANKLWLQSKGETKQDRKVIELVDSESIERYGMYELSEQVNNSNTYVQEPIEEIALDKLSKMKNPRKLYNFKVLDVGEAWNEMRVGAQFRCELYSAGFYGSSFGSFSTVRVNGMTFSENGRLEITCEETD